MIEKLKNKMVFKGIRFLRGGMEYKEEMINPISSLINSNFDEFIEKLNNSNKIDKLPSDVITSKLISEWSFVKLTKSKFELVVNNKIRKDIIYGCIHYGDNSNSMMGYGDKAKKHHKEKPDGGLCLWKGCEKHEKGRPYDSVWSLY